MTKQYPMTASGKEALQHQLTHLKTEKQKEVSQRLKEARKFCDFRDDVVFRELVAEQNALDEQIHALENVLYNAKIIETDSLIPTAVTLGSTVTFVELPNGEPQTYMIVGAVEADLSAQKMSSESPIGSSLLGHKIDDEILIQTPGGKLTVRIVDIT